MGFQFIFCASLIPLQQTILYFDFQDNLILFMVIHSLLFFLIRFFERSKKNRIKAIVSIALMVYH